MTTTPTGRPSLPLLALRVVLACILSSTGAGRSSGQEAPKPPEKAATPAARTEFQPRPPRKYEIEIAYSLEEAVRQALENNLNVQVSRLDDKIRNRELIIAKSVFDPFFNLGASYAKNRDPSVSFFDLGPGGAAQGVSVSPSDTLEYHTSLNGTFITGAQYEVGVGQVERDRPIANQANITFLNPVASTEAFVSAKQPLLKGAWYSVNSAEVRIAQNNIAISREQVELTLLDTVFRVEQAYWRLLFSTRNLEAKVKAYQVTLENLENAQKKRAVGTLAAIDVTTAESQAALRRVELDEAEQLRELSRDDLLDVMNYTKDQSLKERWESGSRVGPFDNVMVVCTTPAETEVTSPSRDEALTTAFQRRPEYRQLELNVQNQEIRADVAKNALLPNLDVTGRWGQLGLDDAFDGSYSALDSGKFYDWQVGLELSIPLSNRGPKSRYRNIRDELRKLKVSKASLENQIVLEVDQAIRKIEYQKRKVKDLDDRVRLQEELLRAERRKVDVGMSIAYTVSVIENDLVADQAESLRARADLQTAKAEYYRAIGALLEKHQIAVDSAPAK